MNTLYQGVAGLVVACLAVVTPASAGNLPTCQLLDANFDEHPVDTPIGSGGPEQGEPVSVDPGLAAIVRAGPLATPSLEFIHAATGVAQFARFAFIDDEEISRGDLVIGLLLHAAQPDSFNFYVREPQFSAHSFLSLSLSLSGDIDVFDSNGFAGTIGQYSSGTDHRLEFVYRMDAGTYDIALDGVPVLTGRSHGVTERGIGSLLIGTSHQTIPGSRVYVDGICVGRGDAVFSAGFE